MQNIINSFKAHLYERTSSPLIGAFIFYWSICNYKLIMIILDGDMKLMNKFELIKSIYPQEKITLWNGFDLYYKILLGNGLLIPLIVALAYILLLPFASNFIYKLWIKHQNKLKEISNGKVLTKKEFGLLQQQFTELELSFDEKFTKKDNEIQQLKSSIEKKDKLIFEYQSKIDSNEESIKTKNTEIEYLRKELDKHFNDITKKDTKIYDLENKIKELEPNIKNLEQEVMKLYINDYKIIFSLEDIINILQIKELEAKYIIDNLLNNKLIEPTIIPNIYPDKTGYQLSKKGERFLVEKNLL